MAFTFNGDETLVYPNIIVDGAVLVAEPGKSYDLDSAPDDRWTSATASAPSAPASAPSAPASAPEATPADSAPSTDETPASN